MIRRIRPYWYLDGIAFGWIRIGKLGPGIYWRNTRRSEPSFSERNDQQGIWIGPLLLGRIARTPRRRRQ